METVLAQLHARLHDLALPKQQKMLTVDSNTIGLRVVESVKLNKCETPAVAVTRVKAIGTKYAAATKADCEDLVGIAIAFPADADVQHSVFYAMTYILAFGGAEGARKLLAAGGHRVAVAALHACSTNAWVLHWACAALWYIADVDGADGIAAIRAVDYTLMEKLRQASDAIRAAGWGDWAAGVLRQLGLPVTH
jgi:hypothetical protein